MIALLNGSQRQFIDKSSKLVLHESTGSKEDQSTHNGSDSMDLKDWSQNQFLDIKKMVNGTNIVNIRLIKLLRLLRTKDEKKSTLLMPVKTP